MAIYRGTGGAGDSTTDATVSDVTEQATIASTKASEAAASATSAATSASQAASSATSAANSAANAATAAASVTTDAAAAEAAKLAAQAAQTAAELAETGAETAETNAETAETNAASSASAASTSATNAANSASSAATSASNASTSASAAATSATDASTSASSAATSATSAATSAGTATTQATAAAASATSASNSATAAASSASAASTSATNAATSETNAATSAANASTSETNASASETAAASSAASASTSASNAATSATSASNSASAASTSAINAAASETAAAGSASAASASADAALAALDSFDDRYLGQKASAPTVDNDGDPLVTGALYFDTTDDAMKVWDGTQWLNAYASLSGALIAANNLSDLTNAATARTNLGLGTAATTNSTAYATAAQGALADSALQSGDNISELTNNSGYITGNQTITLSGDVSGSGTTSIVVTVADDSHNHIIANVDGLQAALDGKVDDSQVLTNVPSGAVFTDTTYSVGNGGLTEINFTSALNSKLAGIEAGATADQTASEILTAIKAVDGSGSGLDADLLDGQQGTYYAAASSLSNYLPLTGGTLTGGLTLSSTYPQIIFTDTNNNPDWTIIGANGRVGFYSPTTGIEQVRVNSSGIDVTGTVTAESLGIGTTSPATKLHIAGTNWPARFSDDGTGFNLDILHDTSLGITSLKQTNSGGDIRLQAGSATGLLMFDTANSERMRINSNGHLLLGKTSDNWSTVGIQLHQYGTIAAATNSAVVANLNRTGTDGSIIDFRNDNTTVGSVSVSGSVTLYNTTSDQRLKENIADSDDAGSKIDAIQVRQYDWKSDGSHQDYGMIAQELQVVAPEAVTVPDNSEEMMSVDYSKLVPMLIKEIQSLRNRVAQLEE